MTSNVAASTTAAGNAAIYIWLYQGPAINPDPAGPLVTSDVAIQRVFDWFDANGGIDGRTCRLIRAWQEHPDSEPLKSPNADEYTVGTSRSLGGRGTLRVDGVWRSYHDFYSQRADMSTGSVTDDLGNRLRSVPRREHEQREAPLFGTRRRKPAAPERQPRRGRQLHALAHVGQLRRRNERSGTVGRAGFRLSRIQERRVELAGRRSGGRPASSCAPVGDVLSRRCRRAPGRLRSASCSR